MTRNERWILSEWRVAVDRVTRLHESLLSHREKTSFAEVDLLFRYEDGRERGISLVEVKSWSGDLWRGELISSKQAKRLENARAAVESRTGEKVRLLLAVVGASEREGIRYFPFPL